MKYGRVWLIILASLVGSLPARAELTLVCEIDGKAVSIAAVERGRIFYGGGEKKFPIPASAKWRIEGALVENAEWVQWSPSYSIQRVEKSDAELAKMERPYVGSVSLRHTAEMYGKKQESALLRDWPGGVPQAGLAVLAWVVEGKFTAVTARPVPSTERAKYFDASHKFELSKAEAAGYPVAMLWVGGKLIAPQPAFKEAKAQKALVAVMLGNEAVLRETLAAGADPRAVARNDMTLLGFAAEAGQAGAADILISAGAKPGESKKSHLAPLISAVRNGRLAVVDRLIAARVRLSTEDDANRPLHAAINAGYPELALRLIEAGAPLETRDEFMHTPFTSAMDKGQADVARAIQARKVTFDFRNEQMPRVLITQAALGHTAMVRLFLEKKVKPDVEYRGTALIAAAKSGDPELIKLLLAAGAVPDRVTADGATALMSAALEGKVEAARALLEAGAMPNTRLQENRTALLFAVYSGSLPLVNLLLEKGADVSLRDAKKFSALDVALSSNFRDAARALAVKGAKIDLSQPNADSLLEQAIVLDVAPVINAALADGWSPAAKLKSGWSPLQVATLCDAMQVADVLRAADPKLVDAEMLPVAELQKLDARPKLQAVRMPVDPRDIDDEFPESTVEVDVVIDAEGKVCFRRLYNAPSPRLGLATLDVIGAWRFVPPTKDGKPVAVKVRMPVGFPSSTDRAMDVSDVDVLPVPVKQERPVFPRGQDRDGMVGEVRLRFVVTKEGRTEYIRVVSSPDPAFEESAVKALKNWIFKPGMRDGEAVNVRIEVPIIFSR